MNATVTSISKNFKLIAGVLGTLFSLIAGYQTLKNSFENTINDAIERQTVDMRVEHAQDLRDRILVQESQIKWLERNRQNVPEWMGFQLQLTKDRLEQTKKIKGE